MNIEKIKELISEYFVSQIAEDARLYFKYYFCSKNAEEVDIINFLEGVFGESTQIHSLQVRDNFQVLEIDESPVIHSIDDRENWFFIYTSDLSPSNKRYRLADLDTQTEWVLDGWIPSQDVDNLYQEYAPENERVRIQKNWDPYWIYEKDSNLRPEMQEYIENNLEKFVERDIEFNISTPKWMVDKILESELSEELQKKSETDQSRFEFELPNPGTAKVTVEKDWMVIHRGGEYNATYKLVGEVEDRTSNIYDIFEEIIPDRSYKKYDSGIVDTESYSPPKTLKLTFPDRSYGEEASIKLSNLLTVGQSDAKIHGVILEWGAGLEFSTITSLSFDNSEYEIYFTEDKRHPTLYIHPVNGSVTGLMYLYRKLSEKFDPQMEHSIVEPEGTPTQLS